MILQFLVIFALSTGFYTAPTSPNPMRSNYVIFRAVQSVCEREYPECPKLGYVISTKYSWEYNETAIIDSELAKTMRTLPRIDTNEVINAIRKEFCCDHLDECLLRCEPTEIHPEMEKMEQRDEERKQLWDQMKKARMEKELKN